MVEPVLVFFFIEFIKVWLALLGGFLALAGILLALDGVLLPLAGIFQLFRLPFVLLPLSLAASAVDSCSCLSSVFTSLWARTWLASPRLPGIIQ